MGHAVMGRMLWIVGLAFVACALVAGSPDPDHWSGTVRAFMLVIAGSTVLMNAESALARLPAPGNRARRPMQRFHPAG